MNILVVEDDDDQRTLISYYLRDAGCNSDSITYAHHGFSALEKIKETEFNIIVTDLDMPGMNGYELLEHLTEINHPAKVIIYSAWLNEIKLKEKYKIEATLVKPFARKQFVDLMKYAIYNTPLIDESRKCKLESREL